MAERIVRFIEGGDRFVLGQISVAGRGMGMGAGFTAGGLLPASAVPGASPSVARRDGVQAQVMLPLNPTTSQFMTLDAGAGARHGPRGADRPTVTTATLPVASGRFLREGIAAWPCSGSSIAASRGLGVGGEPDARGPVLRGRGCPRADADRARPLRHRADRGRARAVGGQGPAAAHRRSPRGRMALQAGDLNTGAAVGWRDGEDPDDRGAPHSPRRSPA